MYPDGQDSTATNEAAPSLSTLTISHVVTYQPPERPGRFEHFCVTTACVGCSLVPGVSGHVLFLYSDHGVGTSLCTKKEEQNHDVVYHRRPLMPCLGSVDCGVTPSQLLPCPSRTVTGTTTEVNSNPNQSPLLEGLATFEGQTSISGALSLPSDYGGTQRGRMDQRTTSTSQRDRP